MQSVGFDKNNTALEWFYSRFNLEAGLILGTSLILLGALILAFLVIQWLRANLLPLARPEWASFGATLIVIGCNICFSSLFISMMSMEKTIDGQLLTFSVDRAASRKESLCVEPATEATTFPHYAGENKESA